MDESQLSVDAQLAVIRTKMDQLIDLNRTRGEDHETRLRALEATYVNQGDMERRTRRILVILTTVCSCVTALGVLATIFTR